MIALPLLIVLSACASMPTAGGAGSIRFMTYNIHAGQDASAQRNIERVADLIRQVGADIVLLQEVDRRTQRAGGADHLAELERLTGMHAAFGKSLDYQGGDYGIALLSRWPLDTVQLVHNYGSVQGVLDHSSRDDVVTSESIIYLLQNEYVLSG